MTLLLSFGCGKEKVIEGRTYKPIGVVNIIVDDSSLLEPKYKNIQYGICWGNIIWGIILSETLIAPIYFFGFSMFNPVNKKVSTQ